MVITRKIFWDKDLAVEEPEPVAPPKQTPKFDLDEVLLPKPVTTIKSPRKTRNLTNDERTTMRVYFVQKEGRVDGDDCVELKTMLSPDLSLWQVTGFISLLHHEVAEGKVIGSNTIQSLSSFVDRFRELNFVGDRKIEDQLDDLQKTYLNVQQEPIRGGTELQVELKRRLTELVESVSDKTDINTVTGEYSRKVQWDVTEVEVASV